MTRALACGAVAAWLVVTPHVAAQRPRADTVTVEYQALVSPGATMREAQRRALDEALAEAVRRAAGARVSSTIVSSREERSAQKGVGEDYRAVVTVEAEGRVVAYVVLDSGWVSGRGVAADQLYYRVVVRALVQQEEGTRDPSLTVSLSPSATLLRVRGAAADNDEVVLTVRASFSGFVTLLSVFDDSAMVLVPNPLMPSAAVSPGAELQLPSTDWRERGVRFRAQLPEGVAERVEQVVSVVTRRPVAPPSEGSRQSFERWLVGIPLGDRAVAAAIVRVVREGSGRPR